MARYLSTLTTYEKVIRQLAKVDPNEVASPAQSEFNDFYALLADIIPQASRTIQLATNRAFVPYRDTREYYFRDLRTERQTTRYKLSLGEDALTVSSVVYNDVTLDPTQWRLHPANVYPSTQLAIDPANGAGFDSSDFNAGIEVTGVWGYHEQISQAWTNVETIAGSITSSATSLTVANAARYETLQYIRIEDEYLQISAINTSTNVLTVQRGVNGTTAAAHSAFAIDKFNVMPDISYCATRLAAWSYQSRSMLQTLQYADSSSAIPQLPEDIRNIIGMYQRVSALSV